MTNKQLQSLEYEVELFLSHYHDIISKFQGAELLNYIQISVQALEKHIQEIKKEK